jgi:tight adherence protein C
VLPVLVFGLIFFNFGTGTPLIFAVIFAMIAFYVPNLWLGRAINARRREIRNGLPDAIDLLIVCIESGSGLDQALNRVAEELVLPYPALARELELISSETRAGKPRMEAFRNFAERTKVDDVRSLVAMLIQTDRFGTSLGLALRTHAETSRTKRRQRAEEKAAKLGVKLLFPLVFCMFPAFYLIVLGPSMLRIFRIMIHGDG